MAGFQGKKKVHPSGGGLSRGRGVKVNKIDPCANKNQFEKENGRPNI